MCVQRAEALTWLPSEAEYDPWNAVPSGAGVPGGTRRLPGCSGGEQAADHTVLSSSYRLSAISALQGGSFRSPALQNIDLLHNCLFMDLGAAPQLFLHIPGVTMKARGLTISRATARARRASGPSRQAPFDAS